MFARNILATFAFLAATAVGAAAPLAKTPAPGHFRMMVGDIEVTAISDGTVDLPVNQLLTNTTAKHVDQVLAKNFLKSPLETSVNAYLVNTGSKLVLIDAGAGSLFGPTLGKLAANIKAAGYQPEQVDEIYITHMHPDHVGGLSANGAMSCWRKLPGDSASVACSWGATPQTGVIASEWIRRTSLTLISPPVLQSSGSSACSYTQRAASA